MLVNIKFVNLPSAQSSGKYGSIVTQDGVKIYVPVDLITLFRSGMSTEISVKEQTWGTTPVIVATSGPGGVPQASGARPAYQGAAQAGASPRANTGFQPKVIQGGPSAAPDDDKSRNIFVCGVVQQAMNSGKFAASEIAVLTTEANRAFDLIGARPTPQRTLDQMTDPVPEPEPGDPGPVELQ
jgi:hypothetical protein